MADKGALAPGKGPQAKCAKCGDVIQSTYRWDFKACKCGAIFIDGGDSYTRCGGNPEDFLKPDGTPFFDKKKESPDGE